MPHREHVASEPFPPEHQIIAPTAPFRAAPVPHARTAHFPIYIRFPSYAHTIFLGPIHRLSDLPVHPVSRTTDPSSLSTSTTWPKEWLTVYPCTPLNAIVPGPVAGGEFESDDQAPRSVSADWFDVVCPRYKCRYISTRDVKPVVSQALGIEVLNHWATSALSRSLRQRRTRSPRHSTAGQGKALVS